MCIKLFYILLKTRKIVVVFLCRNIGWSAKKQMERKKKYIFKKKIVFIFYSMSVVDDAKSKLFREREREERHEKHV